MDKNARPIQIGIMGFGNIGTGTYMTLEMNRPAIKTNTGIDFYIKTILEKDVDRERGVVVPKDIFTQDPEDLFSDPEIDIVIELLGGVQPATDFMISAMNNGKHVVTANKAAVAANYEELREAAQRNKVMFRYEASVGGGIPILTPLISTLRANTFVEVQGILNGTTNYILSQITATEWNMPMY